MGIERGVVDDDLGVFDIIDQLLGNVFEMRMARQEFGGQPMNTQGFRVAVAVRLQVQVQIAAGKAAINHNNTGQLDDATALRGVPTGSYRLNTNLTYT